MHSMKNIVKIAAVAIVLAGCTRMVETTPSGNGNLSLSLDYGGDYITRAEGVDVNDFKVSIVRPSDGWTKNYERFADMPVMLQLGSGDYTITASSPATADAAFDQPIYSGSADFSILSGEVTPVSLVCSLSNMKVTFSLSENFRNELSDYAVTVTNATSWNAPDAATRTLVWGDKAAVDANTPGYFTVAPLMVKVDGFRAIDGSEAHAQLAISNVAARDHHIIALDAKVTGTVSGISLLIDDSLNEKQDDVNVDGWDEVPVDGGEDPVDDPDDPTPSTAPTMVWEANPTFADTPIAETMNVDILINVPEGIKTFIVDVDSYVLSETIAQMTGHSDYTYSVGNPFPMDLIDDAGVVSAMNGMIPVGEQLKDKTEVLFSLSQLVPLISMYSPSSGSRHTFTLKVTDNAGQSLVQPVVFVMP